MLSLNRRVGESISLRGKGFEVAIIVTEIRKGQVKLGFEAPMDIEIEREEIGRPTEMLARARAAYNRRCEGEVK